MIKYSSDTVFFFLTIITYNLEIFIVILVQADNGLIMRDIPGERVVKKTKPGILTVIAYKLLICIVIIGKAGIGLRIGRHTC
jgi:hypothetical protein